MWHHFVIGLRPCVVGEHENSITMYRTMKLSNLIRNAAFAAALILTSASFAGAESRSDWQANWITHSWVQSATNTWISYRKEVNVTKVPDKLVAKIAADTKYWMWINGELAVFEGGLKRGPSPNGTYYDKVDIAPFLKEGENTIAILLWHFGKQGFSHNSSGQAALIFEAVSPELRILSDKSWLCIPNPAYGSTDEPHPNYRLPESNIRFDARKEQQGWNMPGFDVRGKMHGADNVDEIVWPAMGELVERPIPMWKDYGLKDYVSVRQSNDTIYCKLPYNAQVTPYLKVEAKGGEMVGIMTDNYSGGSAYNVRAEYIARDGVQEYESLGWMNGHEVWYIVPSGVNVLELKYRETGYDAEFSGTFECEDPFLNELWKRSARTLYITMRDTYMDCPDRERAQWWGDEVNELGEAFYALSPSAQQLARKGILELVNWQETDGVLYSPVPSGNRVIELPLQSLASVGWYGFHTQYWFSGDSSFVAEAYPKVERYLLGNGLWTFKDNGLLNVRPGDWNWGDWGDDIDLEVLTNCWYYLALKSQKEFARILGKKKDVEMLEAFMKRISDSFDARYWTGTAYRDPDYTKQTDDRAQAMAIVSGLATPDKYPALFETLKKEYHASPYMEKYVLEALFKMGHADFAIERMKSRYAKMLKYDYTTLFEGWGIGSEGFGGGTINHAWSGGPLTILSQKLCGIEPTAPAFKTFEVKPQMGSLKTASASLETHYGMIRVSINRKSVKSHVASLTIEVPEGTAATVTASNGKPKTVGAGKYSLKIKVD